MKKYLKNLIKEVLNEIFEEKMGRIQHLSVQASHRELFSYIGIDRLKKIIEEIEKKDVDNKYTSLSELYSRIIRENLARENTEMIHKYYELLPQLDAFKRAVNKIVE